MNLSEHEHFVCSALLDAQVEGNQYTRQDLLEAIMGRSIGGSNRHVNFLVDVEGKKPRAAEREMRDDVVGVYRRSMNHILDQMVERGWIREYEDGVLGLGKLPRGYNPAAVEFNEKRETDRFNLRDKRRRLKGWSNLFPRDPGTIARMVETMKEFGWSTNIDVLLDADGYIADGKHRVEAAKQLGINWRSFSRTIEDEFKLVEEVEQRNVNRSWALSNRKITSIAYELQKLRPSKSLKTSVEEGRRAVEEAAKLTGVSTRTAYRATKEARDQENQSLDEDISEKLSAGKSKRQVAKETGADRDRVSRVADSRQRDTNPPEAEGEKPRVEFAICGICRKIIFEDEREKNNIGRIVFPRPGHVIAEPVRRRGRRGGGGNRILGDPLKGDYIHATCADPVVQESLLREKTGIPTEEK